MQLAAEDSNRNDAASSSQVWQTDAKMNAIARRLAAVDTSQDQNLDDSKWPHNLRVSRADRPHLEKVYSNWRRQLKREAEATKIEDHNKNTMIW